MRKVLLRKSQFDDFFYPACSTGPVESMEQLPAALRLMSQLQDPTITEKEVISEDVLREYAKARQKPIAQQLLSKTAHEFHFEEDEWTLALSKLKAHIHRVNMIAITEFNELLETFQKAPKITEALPAEEK